MRMIRAHGNTNSLIAVGKNHKHNNTESEPPHKEAAWVLGVPGERRDPQPRTPSEAHQLPTVSST